MEIAPDRSKAEDAQGMAQRLLEESGEPAVGDYAVLGNGKTVALLSRLGSLDWLCLPHFSGPSVFAALLDHRKGGRFVVRPRDVGHVQRTYLDGTAVVCTEYTTDTGRVRVLDFMALSDTEDGMHAEHEVVRIAECVEGVVQMEMLFQPRPDYARALPKLRGRGPLGWHFERNGLAGHLVSDMDIEAADAHTLVGRRRLAADESCTWVLGFDDGQPAVLTTPARARILLRHTVECWQAYSARCTYAGPYREAVLRSRLTLRLLDASLTGALMAAGTTSLPEAFDGDRNWDYRYCWLRDAGQIVRAFVGLGYAEDARSFLEWMLHATRLTRPELQPVYDEFGRTRLPEFTLDHLRGYRGHGPVRVGNKAREQVQLDVYGDVVLAACDLIASGTTLDAHDLKLVADFVEVVMERWREPDHGIWEVRKPKRHHTHSKLMCWAALDAALKLDEAAGLPIDRDRVMRERDAIDADIETHALHRGEVVYSALYEELAPDATLLLMPIVGFRSPNDPRVHATFGYVDRELGRGAMMYRYPPGGGYDGLEGNEHPFGICAFWMVEGLALQGRLEEAHRRFQSLATRANELGLFAEQMHAETGEPVGNLPQGLTHVGLINAALALEKAAGRAS